MRHMKFIKAACVALLLTAASAASAANLVVQDGKLTGATGVNVGGTLYDVQFVDGICASLFNGCDEASDFDFTDEMSATAAAQALLDQVFIDGPSGNFDTMPSLVLGCGGERFCLTFIPLIRPNGALSVVYSGNFPGESADDVRLFDGIGANIDYGSSTEINFAKFSLSPVAAVPEPNSWALMIAGFGLVGAATRRRRAARQSLA